MGNGPPECYGQGCVDPQWGKTSRWRIRPEGGMGKKKKKEIRRLRSAASRLLSIVAVAGTFFSLSLSLSPRARVYLPTRCLPTPKYNIIFFTRYHYDY